MNAELRFYLHRPDGSRQGPYDLAGIIRKSRNGSVKADSMLSDADGQVRKAVEFEALAQLFQVDKTAEQARRPNAFALVARTLRHGWRFVSQQPMICVVSGVGVMFAYIAALIFTGIVPWWSALWLWIVMYLTVQAVVMAMVLRLYRGQYLDADFMRSLGPAAPRMLLYAVVVGMLSLAGLLAGVLPGLCLLAVFIFVPYHLGDQRQDLAAAMQRSAKTAFRGGAQGFAALFILIVLNVVCALLILPLPFLLPMLAAAIAELYDEWAFY